MLFSKKLHRCERGATAIEFALLAMPFVFLLAGTIEVAIMYAAASMLEGATNSASRLIKTGQIQQDTSGTEPVDIFRAALCDYATALVNCDDVIIEAIPIDSFMDADEIEPQYDENGNLISQGFDAGTSNERILIRTFYRYPLMTPFIGPLLGGTDGSVEFVSTIVQQTEPFEFVE